MTTPDQPTPARVLELAELLEKQAKKASPHLWPEQCEEIAATLRAQAAALAEREAECERLRAKAEVMEQAERMGWAAIGLQQLRILHDFDTVPERKRQLGEYLAIRQALTQPTPTIPDKLEPEQEALSAALEWYAADRELDTAEAEFRMPPAPGELRANGRFGAAQRRKWAAEDKLRAALHKVPRAD